MSTSTMNADTDFSFGSATAFVDGPPDPGYYPATLVNIQQPKPSQLKNEKTGKFPLTSVFEFQFDAFENEDGETVDDFVKWNYINVEARGEVSNFNKVHLALTGQPVPQGAFAARSLIGRRCLVNWGPSRNDPQKFTITGYAPLREKKPRTGPPTPPPDTSTPGGDEEPPF